MRSVDASPGFRRPAAPGRRASDAVTAKCLIWRRLKDANPRWARSRKRLQVQHDDRGSTRVLGRVRFAVWSLRLVRALCAETHETWLEDNRCINMDLLREQKKAAMKLAA